jgi:hypothetical protein
VLFVSAASRPRSPSAEGTGLCRGMAFMPNYWGDRLLLIPQSPDLVTSTETGGRRSQIFYRDEKICPSGRARKFTAWTARDRLFVPEFRSHWRVIRNVNSSVLAVDEKPNAPNFAAGVKAAGWPLQCVPQRFIMIRRITLNFTHCSILGNGS